MIASGMLTRRSFFMNSAFRRLVNGQIPATTGTLNSSIRRKNSSSTLRSKTGCVIANSAPASTLNANRRTSWSMSCTPGLAATAIVNPVEPPIELLPISNP